MMNISNEVIEALAWLRTGWNGDNTEYAVEAFNILDDAGIFKPIDEATGYATDPTPTEWDVHVHWNLEGEQPGIRKRIYRLGAYTEDSARGEARARFLDDRKGHALGIIDGIRAVPAEPLTVIATYPIGPDGETGYAYSDSTHDEGEKNEALREAAPRARHMIHRVDR